MQSLICWKAGEKIAALVALPLCLMLCGCGPDGFVGSLDIATPPHFIETAKTAPAPAPTHWLASFRSSELSHLGDLARDQNLDIAAAVARIEQAEAQAMVTAAALFPTLNAGSTAARTQTPGVARFARPPYTPLRQSLFTAPATGSWTPDVWGKTREAAASSLGLAEASRFARDEVALTTEVAVATLYVQLLTAQDRLRVARENVKLASTVLDAIKAKKAVGTSNVLDEAQQATVVAQQRANIPPLEQTAAQSRVSLAVLIGVAPERSRIVGGSLDRLAVPPIRPGLPSQLLLRRPDVAEAQANFLAEVHAAESARDAFYPSFNLTGSAGLASEAVSSLLNPHYAAYALAASVAQPILDGGALEGQLDFEKGKAKEALDLYRKQVLTAFADVESGLVALQQGAEKLRADRDALVWAKKAYDAAVLQLRAGTIDIVTLSTNENTFFQAEDAVVQARAAYVQAAIALYQALGGGWTVDVETAQARAPELRKT
jgi:NodT family efflux transporter outer membrane factor (OMF) lipoprotein